MIRLSVFSGETFSLITKLIKVHRQITTKIIMMKMESALKAMRHVMAKHSTRH